jgi:hypothetical protein
MNDELTAYIQKRSAELYPESVWKPLQVQCEEIGLCTELYDLRCEVMETCFEEKPELFEGIRWINDENGMPLWVQPGVEWTIEEDDEDEFQD